MNALATAAPPSLWSRLAGVDPAGAAAVRVRAEQVAGDFEQVFVQQLVEGLRRTGDPTGAGAGPFGDGPGADTYTMWFDSLLGERVARTGHLRVADNVVAELERLGQIPRLGDLAQPKAIPTEDRTDALA
ncbi:MAG: hypothetical protein IPM29_29095 [Planctomycetes bacterium]|nr:hypothetical protein [Planctomycetota bacterium]